MARIDPSRIPPRPAGTPEVGRVRNRARAVEQLPETTQRPARPIEKTGKRARPNAAPSLTAPGIELLEPLIGMSGERMIASLSRIENVMARLQEREGTMGEADEITLARMMINEHLRRLRIVEAGASSATTGR